MSILQEVIQEANQAGHISTLQRRHHAATDGAGATTTCCWCPISSLLSHRGLNVMSSTGTLIELSNTCRFWTAVQ
jgi:hypothetical protein